MDSEDKEQKCLEGVLQAGKDNMFIVITGEYSAESGPSTTVHMVTASKKKAVDKLNEVACRLAYRKICPGYSSTDKFGRGISYDEDGELVECNDPEGLSFIGSVTEIDERRIEKDLDSGVEVIGYEVREYPFDPHGAVVFGVYELHNDGSRWLGSFRTREMAVEYIRKTMEWEGEIA